MTLCVEVNLADQELQQDEILSTNGAFEAMK